MQRYASWKYWLIAIVLVVSLMGALPNVVTPPTWWPGGVSKPLNMGLDLKGGIHLVLDVDVDRAVERTVEEDVSVVRRLLRENRMRYRKLD
ncbi:MAG: protein translocase subunit SecD, partial [Mariprofundales bacterium]|nr:protein translocase subunit SecD [Mariprofundales bacterium]